jgi:hypothetical protein
LRQKLVNGNTVHHLHTQLWRNPLPPLLPGRVARLQTAPPSAERHRRRAPLRHDQRGAGCGSHPPPAVRFPETIPARQ